MAAKKNNPRKPNKPSQKKKPVVMLPRKRKALMTTPEKEPVDVRVVTPSKQKEADKESRTPVSSQPAKRRRNQSGSVGVSRSNAKVVKNNLSRNLTIAKKFHIVKRELLGFMMMRLFLRTKPLHELIQEINDPHAEE